VSGLADTLGAMEAFDRLDRDQLEWLAEAGSIVEVEGGETLFEPGPHEHDALWILLEGEIIVARLIGGREIEAGRSSKPGAWAGAPPGATDMMYELTARVARPSKVFRIPRPAVDEMMRRGFPITHHFLMGVTAGTRNTEALIRQQEKLESLGKLAAGLAHEINNPAAAARRASSDLRRALQHLAGAPPAGCDAAALAEIAREVLERGGREELSTLERDELEQELSEWLGDAGAPAPWELGALFSDAGADVAWLESVARRVPGDALGATLAWVGASLEATRLLDDVEQSLGHITDLVQSMKAYTYMDQTPVQLVELRDSIGETLTILRHKLAGIEVEQDYAPGLPQIEAYGSELNQVWTNLLDNAADALGGDGRISIRARRDRDDVVVEVTDDGPGIPEEIVSRIFDAFFTTKDVGQGMGLGLEITHRIVRRHGGDISVTSRPGETRFTVRLPVRLPAGLVEA
jgi:signal transduction histidine kinase